VIACCITFHVKIARLLRLELHKFVRLKFWQQKT